MNSPPMNLPIAIAAIIGKHAGMLLERLPFVIMIFASGLSLFSCSMPSGDGAKPEQGQYGMGAYQQAGGRVAGMENPVTVRVGGGDGLVSGLKGKGITPEEDIVWAPENPDEAIHGGLEQLWKSPEKKSWHQSYTEATQQSRQTGKPLLIWFTDSMHSPTCRYLSEEVFSTTDFETWAMKHVIRLRVDKQIPSKERSSDLGVRKSKYIKKLIKRYEVKGSPTVTLLKPGGEVYVNYRGYKKGQGEYYWARMKQAIVMIERDYDEWREKYEKRGYRLWENREGQKTFAKLYRFHSGSVTLVDPDGKRGKTPFHNLSDGDKAWILLQKKKRDASKER